MRWLLAVLLLAGTYLRAQQVPADQLPARPSPPRLVNDLVGVLSPDEREQLEQKLVAYNDSTSSQITIVIVKTTEPYEPADYAFSIGRKWGVGQQGKDNGLVLLWATDTRKIYIATGRGLEGAIPDAIAKRIISQIIAPNFRQQRYYQGLDEATTEIFRRASGEYKANPSADTEGSPMSTFVMIALLLFFIYIFMRSSRGGGRGGTGYRGGGPIFFPYSTFSGWGSSSGNWGGGGGSGGGFGGFGGGSFGGGGAGGDY